MIAVGIDVGLTGAVAFVDSRGSCQVDDMPTVADGEKGRRIEGRQLIHLLRAYLPPGEPAIVVFEDVRPRAFGNGGKAMTNSMHSQGSLMRSRGIVEAVLDILRPQQQYTVQPQTWKRTFGLIKCEKSASLERARLLYPVAVEALRLVKHHNRAEAVLLAHYALRKWA